MLIPSYDKILRKGDTRYVLVMLASKRARQIIDGSESLIETKSTNPVTIAIEEIVDEKITYDTKE